MAKAMSPAVSYLRFDEVQDTGKTKVFRVSSVQHDIDLGKIKWFATWRRYAFFPESSTVFDSNCLFEIQSFIARLMLDREKYHRGGE
jgi:hypothetical protein